MATNPYDLTGGSSGSTSTAATTQPKWTNADILGYVKNKGIWDGKSPITEQQGLSIHAEAQKYGVTADQLDDALGLGAGTAAQFVRNHALRELNGNTAAYTPATFSTAPAPAPAAAAPAAAASNSTGLVEQAQQRPQAQAATITPSTWSVDDNQLVQTHLNNILKENSPLMQRAEAYGNMQANSRGLVSSSLGVQAAQGAMIDRATPIATSDATTYAQAAKTNAEQGTSAAIENARAQTSTSQFNTEQSNVDRRFDTEQAGINSRFAQDQAGINSRFAADQVQRTVMQDKDILAQQNIQQAGFLHSDVAQAFDANLKTQLQNADLQSRASLAALDNQVKTQLAQFEASYKTSMQTSASMAQSYQSYMNSVTQVILDKDLDGDVKASMISQLGSSYNNTFKLQQQISGLNLGELITGGTVSYTPSAGSNTSSNSGATHTPDQSTGGDGTGGVGGS